MYKIIITTIFTLCIFNVGQLYPSDASKPFSFFHHNTWDMEDGLPMNTVLDITQTAEGYIWLGTEAGLACFDGIRFREYSSENTPAITTGIMLVLMPDTNGGLWIGSRGGGVIRYENGEFRKYTTEDGLSHDEVWSLAQSPDGIVWIGTRNGLNYYREGKIYRVTLPDSVKKTHIKALVVDKKGRLLAGTTSGGLLVVNRRGKEYEADHKTLTDKRINSLLEDHLGHIWVGTKGGGIIRIIEEEKKMYTMKDGLSSNYVECLIEDRAGNIWIGTKGGGVSIYGRRNKTFHKLEGLEGHGSNWSNAIYEDHENTIWIGTQGGGLLNLRDSKISTYTTRNGLSNDVIFGVFEDSQHKVWVGTKGFGANRIDPVAQKVRVYNTNHGLSSNTVISFAEQPEGILWLGTIGGGVNRMALDTGKIDVLTEKDGLSNNFVRALYVDPEGTLWAGTENGGIHLYKNGRFEEIKRLKYRVNTFHKDEKGNLWIGTFGGGLLRYNNGDMELLDKSKGLPGDYVACIYGDKEGALWLGTTGKGLTRYKDGFFTLFSKINGLPDNSIHTILEDDKNHIWASTNRGIFFLNRRDVDDYLAGKKERFSLMVLGVDDGMKSAEGNGGNQPTGWRSHDGKLWFPTTKGVSMVEPENIGINTLPPPVIIESVIIDDQEHKLLKGESFELPPDKRNLEIRFTALSFIGPKRIQFKHKLEGFEEQWGIPGPRRFAIYTNIPPGEYVFRVTACNSDGIWNNIGAQLRLTVRARFYQTMLFKILFPIAITMLGFALYRLGRKYLIIRRQSKKYQGTAITREESQDLLRKVLYQVENQKVYRDSDISLKSLAEKLDSSPRKISQVINEHLNKNFYELINHHRVEEAKKLLVESGGNDISILDICYKVGFNSKSSFNRVFKTVTQLTPTQFRKKRKLGN